MALDGITTQLLADELDNELRGDRIDKVFMPDKHTVILHIRSEGRIKKLLISIDPGSPRINITNSTRENPQVPPSFCMLLRKYLSGSRIISITDPGYERIIEIKVSQTDELHDTKELRLIAELMGRYSNLILLGSTGKILDSAVHVDFSVSRIREVMPARIYEYPPVQNKMNIDEALKKINEGTLPIFEEEMSRPVVKALMNSIKGMSPQLAGQIVLQSNVDERIPARNLADDETKNINKTAKKIFLQIMNKEYTPSVCFTEEGAANEFTPFCYIGFLNITKTATLSEAIDLYYREKDIRTDLDNRKRNLRKIIDVALKSAAHKSELHRIDVEEGKKADIYRKYADLILSNKYLLTDKKDSFECDDYYQDPPVKINIPLDPKLSPTDNAQEYYKKFRKLKRKYELSVEYIEDDRLALDYFRTLKTAVDSASCMEDVEAVAFEIRSFVTSEPKAKKVPKTDPNKEVGKARSGKASSRALRDAAKRASAAKNTAKNKAKEKVLPVRQYETSDGYTILCGRNNIQNDELTFKIASKQDWWFHVKGVPGTHVILKTRPGEKMPSDEAVIKAASTAAFFSRSVIIEEHMGTSGEDTNRIKAEVDYCPVSHVKKIPGGRPGMVIYEGYYSILVPAQDPEGSSL